jgi:hypothetical protein
MGSRKHKEELLSLVSVLVTSSFLKPLLATRIPSEERKKRRKRNESTLPPFPQFLGFPPQTTLTLKKYRLGVARPFLMLKALFLILPLILPFKH